MDINNQLKQAFKANNLAFSDIVVDFDNFKVYVYELEAGIVNDARNIDERYLKVARVLVRRYLRFCCKVKNIANH